MRIIASIILSLSSLCLYSQQARLGIESPDSIMFSLSVDQVSIDSSYLSWEGPVNGGTDLEILLTPELDSSMSIIQTVQVRPNYHLTLQLMSVGRGVALVEFSETPLDSIYISVVSPADSPSKDSTVAAIELPSTCSRVMNRGDLTRMELKVGQAMLDRMKLEIIEKGSAGLCLDTGQLSQLAQMIDFEDARLAFCINSFPRLVDKQNFGSLSKLFLLSVYQRDFKEFVERQLE